MITTVLGKNEEGLIGDLLKHCFKAYVGKMLSVVTVSLSLSLERQPLQREVSVYISS